jgi:DNA-binding beta-propeller fold protein YncE
MTMTKKHRQEIILCILLALVVGLGCALPGHAKKKKKKETKVDLVWPLPPDTPRIRFLEMYTTNFDIEPLKKHSWLDKAIGKPNPNLAELFEKPAGVAIDSQDRILIASLQKSTVYVLDPEKREILRLRGGRGIGLVNPLGVVVDDNDNFFVSDPVLGSVLKFDSEGNLLATLGRNDGMKNPTYMAVDESRRRLFVVDSHLHQVLVYNLDTLMLIATVGERGMGDGQFNYPVGIGVGPDGSFAVTDTGSCSVQVFSPDFEFIRRFGKQGTAPGMFVRPKGVAFDSEGHIYVVDAAFNNFQIFTPEGQVLMFVGSLGTKPGHFHLPNGIYIDRQDRILISDQLNHRVQMFQFLGGY